MRLIAALGFLSLASAAHAANWRPLASPPEYQAAVAKEGFFADSFTTQADPVRA